MLYKNLREEEIKNKLGQTYFANFDTTQIIGNIDFCVSIKEDPKQKTIQELESLMWAEAKRGKADIYESFVQLILTIGKARTFDKRLPPAYLGAFDAEKIGFIPYNDVHDIFYQNDFNWNVTPSDHDTKEFKQVHETVKDVLTKNSAIYTFGKDDKEIHEFVKTNFVVGKSSTSKIRIDKNNFMVIYNKWVETVKPTIAVDWNVVKTAHIIDGDFYLADLLSNENKTIKDKLYVLLEGNQYKLDRKVNSIGLFNYSIVIFTDNQKAHEQFWNKYERPPLEEYWDYIVGRRDLLVPQDVRERKGSFFTPKIWVEKSQEYLADVLGADWQDEYYIWDCAAGTGNLLAGLTNKYNIYASTLDKQDVDVMHDRIKNGANLLESHVFQFDFLNDSFDKLPASLKAIIDDPEKRKKLVMYINPPYAEHGNKKNSTGRDSKAGVAKSQKMHEVFQSLVGSAARELFVQFYLRIYKDLPDVVIASFSKLKHVVSQNFEKFRNYFQAEYKKGFVVPANTFDNVTGSFPISFLIWDLKIKATIKNLKVDILIPDLKMKKSVKSGSKNFIPTKKGDFISDWLRGFYAKDDIIAYLILPGIDMQSQSGVYVTNTPTKSDILQHKLTPITQTNITPMVVYLAVRQAIPATWLNDRDQFLYPKDVWLKDKEFHNDCLAFTLFHGQNRTSCRENINHWIPFTEQAVNAREKFASNFMSRYIAGKIEVAPIVKTVELFGSSAPKPAAKGPLVFSAEAKAVFEAGLELWRYYHAQPNANVNASLYDIREHFQGRNAKGTMNHKSTDPKYNDLIHALRDNLKILAQKIEPKVYEYGFLKG